MVHARHRCDEHLLDRHAGYQHIGARQPSDPGSTFERECHLTGLMPQAPRPSILVVVGVEGTIGRGANPISPLSVLLSFISRQIHTHKYRVLAIYRGDQSLLEQVLAEVIPAGG